MNNINDKIKRGSKKPLTDEEKRIKKNKHNKRQREYYRRRIILNPTRIRSYTKAEKQRKNKQRQALLSRKQGTNKTESKEKIQGKNEK